MSGQSRAVELVTSIVTTNYGPLESTPTPLEGGSINQVFLVKVAGEKLVVRIQTDPERFSEYAKEMWCANVARSLAVPTIEALKMGSHDGAMFVIQRYLEGQPGTAHPDDTVRIWSALGEHMAKIHSVATIGFGLELVDGVKKEFAYPWERYIGHNIESLGSDDVLVQKGIITLDEARLMADCFNELNQAELRLGLCHGDVSLRNTIVDERGKVYLIDWGCAHSDVVPYSDFAFILRFEGLTREEFSSFLAGYGLSETEFAAMKRRVAQVGLLIATDKLRWAIDHGHTGNKRYFAGIRWALKIVKGEGDWFTTPYSEAYVEGW